MELIKGLDRMAREAGAGFVLVRLSRTLDDAALDRWIRRAGVTQIDVSGARGGWLRDGHPDAAWHADVARLIAGAPPLERLRRPGP
jgi:hypothetical protein